MLAVKAGTGSGKSTLIPTLLYALGYKSIAITQPRRMPCKLIYQRVKEKFGKNVAGYKMAGEK